MQRADLTEKILDIKREKGWTWKHICGEIGGMSPFMITGACISQRAHYSECADCSVYLASHGT